MSVLSRISVWSRMSVLSKMSVLSRMSVLSKMSVLSRMIVSNRQSSRTSHRMLSALPISHRVRLRLTYWRTPPLPPLCCG